MFHCSDVFGWFLLWSCGSYFSYRRLFHVCSASFLPSLERLLLEIFGLVQGQVQKGCFPLRHLFLQRWPPFRRCLQGHCWRLLLGQGGLPRLALFLTFSLLFCQDGQARPQFRSYHMHLFGCWFWNQEGLHKRRSPLITQKKFFKRTLSKLTRRIPKAP